MKRTLLAVVAVVIISFTLPFVVDDNIASFMSMAAGILAITCLLVSIYMWRRARAYAVEKNQYQHVAKEQEDLLSTLFSNNNLGIGILNLDGQFSRVNHALCQLLGYSEYDLKQKNFYYLIHPDDQRNIQLHIQELIDRKLDVYQSEQRCYRKDGETVWMTTTLSLMRGSEDKPVNFVVQLQNITVQKKAEEKLKHMAYHDGLTGLGNRNRLEQFIKHVLASSRRHQQGFALLFLDLDRFKNINDTIGHEAGDLLLQIVAERLKSAVRNTDVVARLGGDEFVVVITDVKKTESVGVIAQKILSSVMEVIVVKGQEIYTTTSIGISLYPYDGQDLPTLMKNADLALYRAKEHGRNNYQFYTMEMTNKAQEKMALQNVLGHALVKNEFLLHYQPIIDIHTREIYGVEALLRWKNNEYGYITPDEIISVAEESGLINQVSEWVLLTACKQLKCWHEMGMTSLVVSVNFSGHQFKHSNFADKVLKTITTAGIPPQSLVIEVTESTVMEDSENILKILYSLKDLGVKIAIDDFGTGYWSLSNLRRLSVDMIKIDKTFIKLLTTDDTSSAITGAIIAMMNKLGIKSVAEGVETKEQYKFLEFEGCDAMQGYYITRPLDEEAMTSFLKHPLPDAEVVDKHETTQEED